MIVSCVESSGTRGRIWDDNGCADKVSVCFWKRSQDEDVGSLQGEVVKFFFRANVISPVIIPRVRKVHNDKKKEYCLRKFLCCRVTKVAFCTETKPFLSGGGWWNRVEQGL